MRRDDEKGGWVDGRTHARTHDDDGLARCIIRRRSVARGFEYKAASPHHRYASCPSFAAESSRDGSDTSTSIVAVSLPALPANVSH